MVGKMKRDEGTKIMVVADRHRPPEIHLALFRVLIHESGARRGRLFKSCWRSGHSYFGIRTRRYIARNWGKITLF